MIASVRSAVSGRSLRGLRWVERCRSTTRKARSSETPSSCTTQSTHARRREGLRSFAWRPQPGSVFQAPQVGASANSRPGPPSGMQTRLQTARSDGHLASGAHDALLCRRGVNPANVTTLTLTSDHPMGSGLRPPFHHRPPVGLRSAICRPGCDGKAGMRYLEPERRGDKGPTPAWVSRIRGD